MLGTQLLESKNSMIEKLKQLEQLEKESTEIIINHTQGDTSSEEKLQAIRERRDHILTRPTTAKVEQALLEERKKIDRKTNPYRYAYLTMRLSKLRKERLSPNKIKQNLKLIDAIISVNRQVEAIMSKTDISTQEENFCQDVIKAVEKSFKLI